MPLLIVPDTNVFVHFRPFDDVHWDDVCGRKDVVFVVLAPVVRELDKLKMEPRLREKVRAVLPRIEMLFGDSDEATLRTGIAARFVRIPLDPITCSGRTRSLVPEDPITRIGAKRRGGQVQWF